MNVKQLKKLIQNLPDATPVMCSGNDHDYRDASICVTMAVRNVNNPDYVFEHHDIVEPEEGDVRFKIVRID